MSKRILVVDDEFQIRELVALQFRGLGYEVSLADSGEEGLRMVREMGHSLDLVILDLDLGDYYGLDLLPFMKELAPDLPIVLFTGFEADEELKAQAQKRHADGLLVKTLTATEVRDEIERIMAQSPRNPPD